MKLTENGIGKYFKTRCGQQTFLCGVNQYKRFVFCDTGTSEFHATSEQGYACEEDSSYDIIAPWPETKTIKGWAVLYKSATDHFFVMQSEIFPTKEAAQSVWDKANYRFVEITYTEGEGLDD